MNRKKVSQTIETQVLTNSGRGCALCFGVNHFNQPKDGQIAHLDKNRNNNNFDNLCWLCFEHHNQFDSTTSQSKNYTKQEIKHYRDLLYSARSNLNAANTIPNNDISLFQELEGVLGWDYIAQFKQVNFRGSISAEILRPIDAFRYKFNNPLFNFSQQNIQEKLILLKDSAEQFNHYFNQRSGADGNGFYRIVPPPVEMSQYHLSEDDCIRISKEAEMLIDSFCLAYQNLMAMKT